MLNIVSTVKNNYRLLTSPAYGWLVISLCGAFLFYKYVLQISASVMSHELMAEFHINATGFGNLAATFFYAYIVTQAIVGLLVDKYSPRLLTALAIGLCAVGSYTFSQAPSLLAMNLSRTLMGAGAAFATVSYLKLANVWFKPQQLSFVGGLLTTGALLGAVFGQAPIAWITANLGWRTTLVWCAVAGFILAGLFYLLVRDRNPVLLQKSTLTDFKFSWHDFLHSVLLNKQNWLLMAIGALMFEPVIVFNGLWGVPFLEQIYSLSTVQAASLTSLGFIGMAIGAPIIGLIADRWGNRRWIMIYCAAFSLVLFVTMLYLPMSSRFLGILLFLFGFAASAFMLVFTLGRYINKAIMMGTVVAFINTGDALLGAISEPLVGKFLDMRWTGQLQQGVHYFSISAYRFAFTLLLAYLVLALLALAFLKEPSLPTDQ